MFLPLPAPPFLSNLFVWGMIIWGIRVKQVIPNNANDDHHDNNRHRNDYEIWY